MKFSATITVQYDTPFSPFPAKDWRSALDWLQENGFDAAEVCISDYRTINVPRLSEELTARGLGCSTISTGQARTRDHFSLIDVDAGRRKEAQKRLVEHIDAATMLHSKVTVGLLRGTGEPAQKDFQLEMLTDALIPVLSYASEKGCMLLLEAINRYETCLLNNAGETVEFMDKYLAGSPSVGLLWDVFHANIEDASFSGTIDHVGKRIKHVHLADSNRMFPGFGHIPFGEIVKGLKAIGYDGYCSFECFNKPSVEVIRKEAGRFISQMRLL